MMQEVEVLERGNLVETGSQAGNGAAKGRQGKIAALLAEFRAGKRFLVTSHARPDGDAIGRRRWRWRWSCWSRWGCEAEVVMADPAPYVYRTLPGIERVQQRAHVGEGKETAVLLECDGTERTGLKGLESRRLINIDHHASARAFGAVNWIDAHACAVAVMVHELAVAAGVTITPSMATNLYTAVLTDTGSFTYPGKGPQAFQLASALVAAGADAPKIAREIYFSNREAKLRLLGLALNHLRCEGGLAWSWVMAADLAGCAAIDEDCEGVVTYLIGIEDVRAAVFLRELENGDFQLSIRSKGGIDVSKVASEFCGGGHRNASGCTIAGPLDVAVGKIVGRLRQDI